jgi:sarcosine oxidase delta subunit
VKVAVITANVGNFEKPAEQPKQTVACDFFHFNDQNFSLRTKALTPRLQARIAKMFGWQLAPGYDYYIWVDSSCTLTGPDSLKLFLKKAEDVDVVVFKHPNRNTIQEEADYLKYRLSINCPYITPRYKNELIDEQLAEIQADKDFVDQNLFASTGLVYKNNEKVRDMMKEWWYHTSRYHSIDQLSLPYVLAKSGLKVNVLPDKYSDSPYITYVRNKK